MTKLSKPVSRETALILQRREVIVTIAPCGSQSEARIGFRLKGRRSMVVARVSDLYIQAADWQGQRERAARRAARKEGIPWKRARLAFNKLNSI